MVWPVQGCFSKATEVSAALASFHDTASPRDLHAWAINSLARGLKYLQTVHEGAADASPVDQLTVQNAWAALHLLPFLTSPAEVRISMHSLVSALCIFCAPASRPGLQRLGQSSMSSSLPNGST